MSKYSELLKGDIAPKSALAALARKVEKQGRELRELRAAETARAESAAARTPGDTFVSRDELLQFVDTGNIPDSWVDLGPATGEDLPAADPETAG